MHVRSSRFHGCVSAVGAPSVVHLTPSSKSVSSRKPESKPAMSQPGVLDSPEDETF